MTIDDASDRENFPTGLQQSTSMAATEGRVWVPKESQQPIVEWYHSNLQHALIKRTIYSVGQTFAWKRLSTMVEKHIS